MSRYIFLDSKYATTTERQGLKEYRFPFRIDISDDEEIGLVYLQPLGKVDNPYSVLCNLAVISPGLFVRSLTFSPGNVNSSPHIFPWYVKCASGLYDSIDLTFMSLGKDKAAKFPDKVLLVLHIQKT